MVWVGAIRCESTTDERAEVFSLKKRKAALIVGRGRVEILLYDPGAELRVERREERRSKMIYGTEKSQGIKQITLRSVTASGVRVSLRILA